MDYATAYRMLHICAVICFLLWNAGVLLAAAAVVSSAFGRDWPTAKRLAAPLAVAVLFCWLAVTRAGSYEGPTPIPEIVVIALGYGLLGAALVYLALLGLGRTR